MARLRGWSSVGTILEAIADIPKATDPARLSRAIHHEMLAWLPRHPPVTRLGPGEGAGDEEADGAEGIGPPDQLVGLARGEVGLQRLEGAPVEEEGPGQLDQAGPPVDAGRFPREQPDSGRGVLE